MTEIPHPIDLLVEGPFGRVWDAWLKSLHDVSFAHGSDLVERLGAAGVSDNVARAERVLRWACETGVIRREKNTPTKTQRFFDVSGDNERQGWITSGYSPGSGGT